MPVTRQDSVSLLRHSAYHTQEPAAAPPTPTTPTAPPRDLPPNAWAHASLIQSRFRAARVRRAVHRYLGRAVGVPDLARAKAYAASLLPHDQEGRLLPLSCPIECFTVFGAGVYAYMRWTMLMKRVFFIAFLFSVAELVNNAFGDGLSGTNKSWLSMPTIGNAKQLSASYGASEVLVIGTFL